MIKNTKGMALLFTYVIVALLLIFAGGFIIRGIWDAKNAERSKKLLLSYQVAEAAIDKAISKLPGSTSGETNISLTDKNGVLKGEYSYTITILEADKRWQIDALGYVPNQAQAIATRHLQAFAAKKPLPDNFWSNAIYTAGNLDIKGNAYSVNGDVLYGGTATIANNNITGDVTQEPDINPLIKLSFQELRTKAVLQIKPDGSDNLYTAAEISSGNPPFPTSFWYDKTDPDPTKWVPNVVYVEDDLILNGNVGTIGGFFVVVGNVVTNPGETAETTINGNGQIDGCVYSTGQFRVNGGGTGLNVFGGVWSGGDGARINGNVTIQYNATYMNAIKTVIDPSTIIQLVSYREV